MPKAGSKRAGSEAQAPDVDLEAGPSGRAQDDTASSRVVYIGHVPHGFYEKQMLGYFSQFGKVTRIRLSRSKKTGRAKGYAFVEFQHADVAKVAADAMDGYFLFTQRLTVKLVPPSKVHPLLFQGANRKFRVVPWIKVERKRHDKERTPKEHAQRIAKLIKRDKERQKKIKEAGIEYEYDGLEQPIKAQKVVFSDE